MATHSSETVADAAACPDVLLTNREKQVLEAVISGLQNKEIARLLNLSPRTVEILPARRFPPPWTVEDIGAAFVATDSAGQKD